MAKKGSSFEKYDLAFKIWLVEKYLSGEDGGVKTLAAKAGLKSKTQLRDWIKKYQAGELTDADADKRGQACRQLQRSSPYEFFYARRRTCVYKIRKRIP